MPPTTVYQGNNQRTPIVSRWPVFILQYKGGLKGVLGGNYAYQRASLRMDKRLYPRAFLANRGWVWKRPAFLGRYPILFWKSTAPTKVIFLTITGST